MREHSAFPFLAFTGLLLLAGLGCGVIGFIENPAPLTGPVYWAAATATPIPTVTVFLGMTTPVYPPTPVPAILTQPPSWVTAVPGWTTVTATSTPWWATATPTPPGFTATPLWATTTPAWLTTTPVYITETPVPPWTTTPALPQIGFTTPKPLETPYYRVGTFYMNSDVYVGGGSGLVFRLTAHETQPSANNEAAAYHFFTIRATNYTGAEVIVPVSDVFFIRRVQQGSERVTRVLNLSMYPIYVHSGISCTFYVAPREAESILRLESDDFPSSSSPHLSTSSA